MNLVNITKDIASDFKIKVIDMTGLCNNLNSFIKAHESKGFKNNKVMIVFRRNNNSNEFFENILIPMTRCIDTCYLILFGGEYFYITPKQKDIKQMLKKFIEKIINGEDVNCNICLKEYKKMFQCNTCGEGCCWDCMFKINKCPYCRKDIDLKIYNLA